MSLPDLEAKIGLGNGTISRWKQSSPNTDKLAKVADELNVSIDFLLGREKKDTAPKVGNEKNIDVQVDELKKKIVEQKSMPLYYKGEKIDENTLNFMLRTIEYALEQANKSDKDED